ncbi:MAG: hypothetical protein R6T99_10515 [Bacteroidales bacterium]
MKQKLIATALFIIAIFSLNAQTAMDALRYSRLETGGTARFMALNGAFGALGADFSTLSTNPAGIGLYKTSEFTITPSVYAGGTESVFNGTTGEEARVNFNLGNAGMIFTKDMTGRNDKNGWKYAQFGVGLNRLNDFNNRVNLRGFNPESSILDVYTQYANDHHLTYPEIEEDRFYEYAYDLNPAWWTYLLDTDPDDTTQFTNPVLVPGSNTNLNINRWGSMNEWVFTFGGNYNDVLYIGASLGIPYIRYFEEYSYSESLESDDNDLRRFHIDRELETKGTGFNVKFGLIARPLNWLRIGGAIHSPTYYSNMKDRNIVRFESRFATPDQDGNTSYSRSNSWSYDYEMTTPFRAMGSIAFVIGPYGLLSGEYEYVDYSMAKMHNLPWVNDDIRQGYTATHNFKAGTEWRYNIFSFRAGYAYYDSPYQEGVNDAAINSFSGGLGLRFPGYFIDFTYVHSSHSEDYYLYAYGPYEARAQQDVRKQRFMLTLGTKF